MNMFFTIFILAFLFFSGCSFERVKYFQDPTGEHYISYFPYFIKDTRHIVFTYGKADNKDLPVSYFIAADKGFDGLRCLIQWKGDTAIIYEPYSKFSEVNTNREKRLQQRDIEASIFTSIYNDRSNLSYLKFGDEYE
jgi:hypothetical protein